MSDTWKPFAHSAMVDLAAANISKNDRELLGHLRDALDNVSLAIDAVENAEKRP